jgi:hypothetical protein
MTHFTTTTRRNDRLAGSLSSRRVQCALAAALALGAVAGCKKTPEPQTQATIIDNNGGADPAAGNLAPVGTNAPVQGTTAQPRVRVLGQQSSYPQQQTAEEYPQQPYQQPYQDPNQQPNGQPANGEYQNGYPDYDAGLNQGYDALEQADQAPPPLPVYQQPPAPEPDDLWTPGYWSYGTGGYYWVPGAWVAAPYAGALWTPGYWGYYGNRYEFHRGFWARHIGFYGGINYGFGYFGTGYEGGYWNGDHFFYNRAVNRVNYANIHNVYDRNIPISNNSRISYNGGNGGLRVAPRPAELAVLHEQRTPAMTTQVQFRQEAQHNPQQFYNQNHGQPAQFAANRPVPAVRGIQAPPAQAQQQRFQPGQANQQQRVNQEQQVQQNQRNAQMQQRNVQEQQHTAQMQQQNVQQQQRNVQEQQHNQQLEQRNTELQQRNAQQHNAQVQQQQQQRNVQQEQQRNAQQQQQQRNAEMQQRNMQQQQRAIPQQQAAPAREQHVAPQQPQAQHVQPQPQHVQPQPAPHAQPAAQPHPGPAPQGHAEPHGGGERPR